MWLFFIVVEMENNTYHKLSIQQGQILGRKVLPSWPQDTGLEEANIGPSTGEIKKYLETMTLDGVCIVVTTSALSLIRHW